MFQRFVLAFAIWTVTLFLFHAPVSADVFDDIMAMPDPERPAYIAGKLQEYAAQFSSEVMSFTAVERGTVEQHSSSNTMESIQIKKVKATMAHELTLSAGNRYAKIQDSEGITRVITYNGTDGKRYGFDKNKKMTYVDHFCKLPNLPSMSLEHFVNLTGITTFSSSSNADLVQKVEGYEWGERRIDPKLGDCIILKTESRGERLKVERNAMFFGIRDSHLVLLRDESMLEYENHAPVYGAPALIRYKWLREYEYGQKYGKLLPESWNYVITNEYSDLDGRLLPLSNELQKNPNIIRSTTTTISNVKFLERFPTELFNIPVHPSVPLVDSCQKAAQMEVADELKSRSGFNYWLLGLGVAACAIGAYLYVRSRRI